MRDQNPVVRGKNFKEVGELILTKKLNEKAQKAKDLNRVINYFCLLKSKSIWLSLFTSLI